MFDFLFQNKNKEIQSMAELITIDLQKLNLSKLAIEKAITMIARAIAKSDIIIQSSSDKKREIEYRDDEIKLYPTSCELLRGHEWEYDCSFDSENLLEPAKLFIEKLNLSWDCDSGWIDKNGQLQIFRRSFEEHICLFIRRKSLIEFLIKTKKRLLFRIYKEKMYVPDSGFNSSLHNKRILLCFDGKKYQYLINFEDENDYRE